MFLFDPTFGSSFENCETEIRRILGRAEAQVVFCRRWDERRLAYKIKGRKRGVYVLVFFKSDPSKIAGMERDAQLSEQVLRLLVLRADDITLDMMEKAVAARGEHAEGGEGEKPARPEGEPREAEGGHHGHGRRRRGGRKAEESFAGAEYVAPE
jgi:small subunit ribosomal protein S6